MRLSHRRRRCQSKHRLTPLTAVHLVLDADSEYDINFYPTRTFSDPNL